MSSLFSKAICTKANHIMNACKKNGTKLAVVESCTGGLLGAVLTELPGSSSMFTHGFITYANEAKQEMVGVKKTLLTKYGAVSAEVAKAMAEGALKASSADIAVAITGVAGPDGGTKTKPVGLVHFACAMKRKKTLSVKKNFKGDRSAVRMSAVDAALDIILAELKK